MSDGRRRGGARRAPKSRRIPRSPRHGGTHAKGGARALRTPRDHRVHSLPGTIGMTLVGALLPGTGYLYAGRRALGALILLVWLGVGGYAAWYFRDGLTNSGAEATAALNLAFSPTRLKWLAGGMIVGLAIWAFVVFTSYRLVRPRNRRPWHTAVGNLLVVALCLGMTYPVAQGARNVLAQADLVETVFAKTKSATTPEGRTRDNPWAGTDRVNVLLLGGDGGEGRTGVRTDTVILLSINTHNGRTAMFSLPRNMMNAQFPEDSPLHDVYPYGYDGSLDDAYYMLNAIYGQVPVNHPGILGDSDNEGADAIKQAVSGSLGIPVDYYVLVNLAGFREIVDAMGGITVNINDRVAINGNTDAGIPPTDYLEPGPDQHLDGFHALWFARGRYGSDDYQRMDRQRCTVDAIIDAAKPMTLFRHYTDLVEAGKDVVFTDIPLELAPAFVELALKVKDSKTRSVVFKPSEHFTSADPDFEWMQETVQKAIHPQPKKKRTDSGGDAENPKNVCAYRPIE